MTPGVWSKLAGDVRLFLNELVSGEHSLSKMIDQSKQFQRFFEEAQLERPVEAREFSKVLKNMSYSEVRFDSQCSPLFIIFRLLPVALSTLEKLSASGDPADVRLVSHLLKRFAGPDGYDRVISAAVTGDAMMVIQRVINQSQSTTDDPMVHGKQSDEVRRTLRTLLRDGAVFLASGNGLLTHCALAAMRGKTVFLGQAKTRTPAFLDWPSPASVAREIPVIRARHLFELYDAYHESHFPNLDTGRDYMAFDLTSAITMEEREERVARLAHRFGEPMDAVKQGVFGQHAVMEAGVGSLFSRAQWHYDNPSDRLVEPRVPDSPFDDEGEPKAWAVVTKPMGVRPPLSRNVRAWTAVLRDLLPELRRYREEGNCPWLPAMVIIEIAVCRLANTCTVERWFKQVSCIEGKQRAHTMDTPHGSQVSNIMRSSLKLRVQDLQGLRPTPEFNAQRLLVAKRAPQDAGVALPLSPFARIVFRAYAEFFGCSDRLRSRRAEALKPGETNNDRGWKRRLRFGKVGQERTVRARKAQHAAAVDFVVSARLAGATDGLTGPLARLGSDGEEAEKGKKEEKKEKREKPEHTKKNKKKEKHGKG